MNRFIYAVPLLAGFILDAFIGDPHNIPHPIKAIGSLISAVEKYVRNKFSDLADGGIFLALAVISLSVLPTALLLILCYGIHPVLGAAAESILTCYMLAARCLYNESMKVCRAAEKGDTEGARKAVSMIVGRDTSVLDEKGIIRAAVETVAENTSDGVTAPIFYMAIGGAAAGIFYKSVNTMDSMIGYKNEKYAEIGKFAAKLDDILNFVPSRISAVLMIISACILRYDGKNAFDIWRRDRFNHESPNSAQTESVCAGALDIELAGDAVYFGEIHRKPFIGDDIRPIEAEDIRRANRLMYLTSVLMLIISLVFRVAVIGGIFS